MKQPNGEEWTPPEENWIYYMAETKHEMNEALAGDELILDELFTAGLNLEDIGS